MTARRGPDGPDTPEAPATAQAPAPFLTAPIIVKRAKGKKKRKKKYTSGTKAFQRLALGVAKAGFRTSNSVSEALDTFRKRSNKSARKRRDGLVRDVVKNASRGLGDGLKELSKAPNDVANRIGTRRVWRVFRMASPLGLFG